MTQSRTPSREQTLMQIVFLMWRELQKPAIQQDLDGLEAGIRAAGHGWVFPAVTEHHDDDLLTATEVADLLGYSDSTIRAWRKRHGIKQHNGRYRWGDIEQFIRQRVTR